MISKTQYLCPKVMKIPVCVEMQISHFVQSGVCLLKVLSDNLYLCSFLVNGIVVSVKKTLLINYLLLQENFFLLQ